MGKGASALEMTERGVVAWVEGQKLVGEVPAGMVPDLYITRSRDHGSKFGGTGRLVIPLQPDVVAFDCSDGVRREVQTFRCWGTSHDERRLMVCGICGDICFGDVVDVHEAVTEGCRKCGAGLHSAECVTPYTFGACFRCPGVEAPPMPRGGLVNARPSVGGAA
jgi:hypothetical protein